MGSGLRRNDGVRFHRQRVEVYLSGGDAVDRAGVENVLLFEHAGGEGVGGVAGKHGHPGLGDDGAVVVLLVHEVDGDARNAVAGCQNRLMHALAVHASASELGQQRRMHVEYAVAVCVERARAEHLHVSGKGDQLDAVGLEGFGDRLVETGRIGVGSAAEVARRYARSARPLKREGAGVVRDHHSYLA